MSMAAVNRTGALIVSDSSYVVGAESLLLTAHQDEEQELGRVSANLEQVEGRIRPRGVSRHLAQLKLYQLTIRAYPQDHEIRSTHTSGEHERVKRSLSPLSPDGVPQLRDRDERERD